MTTRLPVVVLISGRGSNMRVLAERAQRDIPIDIRAVISDRANAPGLDLARALAIPTATLALKDFASREAFDERLATLVESYEPQLVVLAGYMKILSAAFVRRFNQRLINIHPSLLPKYPGLHTHRRALEAHDSHHGATVHFVVEELDSGPLIVQGRVPVLPNDTEQSLAARVHKAEHRIYAKAVDWFARGRLRMIDGEARLDNSALKLPVVEDFAE
jgi:phosphoribosylglycinamide formyltransferase 1